MAMPVTIKTATTAQAALGITGLKADSHFMKQMAKGLAHGLLSPVRRKGGEQRRVCGDAWWWRRRLHAPPDPRGAAWAGAGGTARAVAVGAASAPGRWWTKPKR